MVPTMRMRLIGSFSVRAMSERASVMRPIVAQIVRRPLASQSAMAACGSSDTCSIICVLKRPSKMWSDSAKPFSTSPLRITLVA